MNNNKFNNYFGELPGNFIGILRDFSQLLYASLKIGKVTFPRVTFFGGAHLPKENPYINQSYLLAKELSENDIAITTGGGPGIMESANIGASEVGKNKKKIMSLGITVKNIPGEKQVNKYAQINVILNNYFMRKWILINNSIGFVIFPGGFGTMDELATLLTLIQIERIEKVPVVLFGKEFWQPFIDWTYNSALKYGTIKEEHIAIIKVTDNVQEACHLLIGYCQSHKTS